MESAGGTGPAAIRSANQEMVQTVFSATLGMEPSAFVVLRSEGISDNQAFLRAELKQLFPSFGTAVIAKGAKDMFPRCILCGSDFAVKIATHDGFETR